MLRAGDQFNLEEDVSYDQILFIVEQLVKDKQVKVFLIEATVTFIIEYSRLMLQMLLYLPNPPENL